MYSLFYSIYLLRFKQLFESNYNLLPLEVSLTRSLVRHHPEARGGQMRHTACRGQTSQTSSQGINARVLQVEPELKPS